MRSQFCQFLTVAALALGGASVHAQGEVTRLIVPFAPGGAQDVIGRLLAERLGSRLGAPVVVENKAGAGGVIAADAVAKAKPDGRTLLLATGGAITIAPHLISKLSYDPRKDFVPIALVADTPMTLAVRVQSPYANVADLLKDAKANPGKVSFASTGNGTISHLTGELLAQAAGVQLLHVPYRGAGPAITDLLGGQVAAMVTSSASIEPMVLDKKARVLGSFTRAPIAALHGAPTMGEATGLKGLTVPVWVGLLAPAGTAKPVLDKLATELQAICALPDITERFKALGAAATCGGPAELGKVIAEDDKRWEGVIRQGKIQVN